MLHETVRKIPMLSKGGTSTPQIKNHPVEDTPQSEESGEMIRYSPIGHSARAERNSRKSE